MNLTDFGNIIVWWFALLGLGILFLPLTATIFHKFFDLGYSFAKVLGLLLLTYTIWMLGSLSILPFSQTSLFIIFGAFVVLMIALLRQKRLLALPKEKLRVFLAEEVFFLLAFIFWAWVRGHEPSIHTLEKFMDFGFINSLLRSTYFPPADMWMTPYSINYYYFGHLVTAALIKATGIIPAVGYNLMLATLFALTATTSFTAGGNLFYLLGSKLGLRLAVISGALSSFLVTLGGNLHPIYAFFQTYPDPENPVPFWTLKPMFNFDGYWYPNATRFIPFTIHEFPIYSFVVADLHGHVLNIPFVLLIVALGIKIFQQSKLYTLDYLLIGLLIATNLMTNVLDGPIYVVFFAFLLLAFFGRKLSLKQTIWQSGRSLLLITALGILFSLPFWLNFAPFAQGVGVLCAPDFLVAKGKIGPLLFEANHCARSPFWMLAILWGFPFVLFFGFITFVLTRNKFFTLSGLWKKPANFFKLPSPDLLAVVFVVVAAVLITIPEFFYAKDIYPAHYRANTVFKFGYQAFILLGLTGGYMIVRIFSHFQKTISYILYSIFFLLLFFLVAIYPYFAINSYYGDLQNYQGQYGLTWLDSTYPSDYQAILWLQQNISDQPVILEAQGDSYTDFARVSANTGLPTVIGWPVHEWLWRGSYDEPGKRSDEVTQIYESRDISLTKRLLSQYNVAYVFVGTLERQKYSNLDEAKFAQLGRIIYNKDETKIYQLYR